MVFWPSEWVTASLVICYAGRIGSLALIEVEVRAGDSFAEVGISYPPNLGGIVNVSEHHASLCMGTHLCIQPLRFRDVIPHYASEVAKVIQSGFLLGRCRPHTHIL